MATWIAIMTWFAVTLRSHPEVALFLTLATGYAIGRIKLGSLPLGTVVGVLVAGILIGQIGIVLSADLKNAFFLLFLFAIGHRTGPQFFNGIRASGVPQVVLTVLLCGIALVLVYALSRTMGLHTGAAAGLMAGAMTESAALGTAADAIGRLPFDAAARQRMLDEMAVAFAVTYFTGVVVTMLFISRAGPWILRVKDLAAECKALEREMGMMGTQEATAWHVFAARAYRVQAGGWAGKTVAQIEAGLAERGQRVFIARLRQGGKLVQVLPDTPVESGDVIALAGRRAWLIADAAGIGPEVDDRELLQFEVQVLDAVVTAGHIQGKTLGELAWREAGKAARGVGLRAITRAGTELAWTLGTKIARGDVLTLVGSTHEVERVAGELGYADRRTHMTDMSMVGAAVFLGSMIGIPAFAFGQLEIGLSQSVGVLAGGLALGWLCSVNRRFGRIPEAALWLFDSLGLAVFLAGTALAAGPGFVRGLQDSGPSLVGAAVVLAVVPLTATLLVGKHLFHMHPGILLGVCCGACTSAPSLAAVQESARSRIPTLGYGVTYAVGNVLLALWGTVTVALVH